MALEPGTTLGPYQVTAKIGEGGMGEVYRARDTKLDRDVALKVLPQAFTDDPDRLARFEREAKVLASLNHPNIGHIYGLEEAEGTRALVLELIEGPTLADRIAQGPIPVEEALPIAKQIAEALEAAHEAGVIHRDLKPANIKVKDDGTVKVLDFGLAKAFDTTPEGDPSQSPTLTASAMGAIIGTAAYMSPEQARGKPVDRRSDIWAFGAIVYEILSGKRAFEGQDVYQVLWAVNERDPDWDALPGDLGTLGKVMRRCLAKKPRERLRDIGDAWLEIREAGRIELTHGSRAPDGGRKDGDAPRSRINATAAPKKRKWTLSFSTSRGRRWAVKLRTSVARMFSW
jgi:serine/threonine protein kinase